MPPLKTRPCTEVYTTLPPPEHIPEFLEREIPRVESFAQKPVKGRKYLTREEVVPLIEALIAANQRPVRQKRRRLSLQPRLLQPDPS